MKPMIRAQVKQPVNGSNPPLTYTKECKDCDEKFTTTDKHQVICDSCQDYIDDQDALSDAYRWVF